MSTISLGNRTRACPVNHPPYPVWSRNPSTRFASSPAQEWSPHNRPQASPTVLDPSWRSVPSHLPTLGYVSSPRDLTTLLSSSPFQALYLPSLPCSPTHCCRTKPKSSVPFLPCPVSESRGRLTRPPKIGLPTSLDTPQACFSAPHRPRPLSLAWPLPLPLASLPPGPAPSSKSSS